jgi:hypothetical protein
MAAIYKILCEVKWLHEYYLTASNGETVFDFPSQNDRINFLFQQFVKDGKTINHHLEFVIPEPFQQLFKDYNLRIVPSYSGFKLAVKCTKKILPEGTTVFQPTATIPDALDIMIMARERNNIHSISNISLKSPFAPRFYFTNDEFPLVKTYPFLSAPVAAFDPARLYEQGEIAEFAANDVREFLNNGAVDPWLPLQGTGYINESERLLVPLAFSISFSAVDNVSDVIFTLKDANGNEVKVFRVTKNSLLKTVWLNFRSDSNSIITIPAKSPGVSSLYTLDITGNNGYQKSFKLLFAEDTLNIFNQVGLISLKSKVSNTLFNLTDNEGNLQTRILADNTQVPPPVFELWMKSRLVFWQYLNNKQKKIKLTTDTQDLLAENSGVLITKNPRSLTYSPVLLKKPDNTFQYLPNPLPGDNMKIQESRFLMNILVPESKMFPLA